MKPLYNNLMSFLKDANIIIIHISTINEAENLSHLYLWQPEANEPTLLTTHEGSDGFQNFAWLPGRLLQFWPRGVVEICGGNRISRFNRLSRKK